MTAGRPTKYTQELADKICDRLSDGESLRKICKDEDMPSKVTVFAWMRKHEGFLNQYTRAKQESADAMAEDLLDIADDSDYDIEIPKKVERDRLRIEARKWLMAKMKPKKYGDKLELSGDEDAPLKIIIKLPGQNNETPELES